MMNATAEQFQKLANEYNKMAMESWSSMTKKTIQSDSFTSGAGAFMDWSLASHKMMTELSGQFMESLDIPKRSDLARISAQVQSVESRVLDQEDKQDEIRDLLTTLLKKLDEKPSPATENAAPVVQPEVTQAAVETSETSEKVSAAPKAAPAKKITAKAKRVARTTRKNLKDRV